MKYDLAIIGGGPAGYSAAFEAIGHGLSVIMFEGGDIGGTCLNRGCVPTKFLMHTARKYHDAKEQDDGLEFDGLRLNYDKVLHRMNDDIVSSLREGLEARLVQAGVVMVRGKARIADMGVVKCGPESYDVGNILIATGAVPKEPVVKGTMSSDDMLGLGRIPGRLHIIGGGSIAVEFADIFRMFGSDVTVHLRSCRILRTWEREISTGISQSLKRHGITIVCNEDLGDFTADEGDMVLSAIGRKALLPETIEGLVEIGDKGGILVDEYGRTRTEGIYAAGDVLEGSPQLAHVAMEQGRRVVRHIAGEEIPKDFAKVRCIYTSQEAASVGMTEAEAKERGIDVISAKSGMYSNARTLISTNERGFVKILADRRDGVIIGAHLMCERAGDMVMELTLAIDRGLTAGEMLRSVRPHPSYSEVVTDVLCELEKKRDAG